MRLPLRHNKLTRILVLTALLTLLLLPGAAHADTILVMDFVDPIAISMTLDSTGTAFIAYRDQAGIAGPAGVALFRCNSVTLCDVPTVQAIDADSVASALSVALDNQKIPAISYSDEDTKSVKLARCNSNACDAPTIHTLATAGGFTSDVTFDSQDKPIVAYVDGMNADLKIAFCQDSACSTWTTIPLDDNAVSMQKPSLEMNSSGYPVISYYRHVDSPVNSVSQLLRCHDALCADFTIVDLAASVGNAFTGTMRLAASDIPVMLHFTQNLVNQYNAVKYVRCNDSLCSSLQVEIIAEGASIEIVSDTMDLDSQDRAYIVYFDRIHGTTNLVRCVDADCENVEAVWAYQFTNQSPGPAHRLELHGDIPVYSFVTQTLLELYLYNGHNNPPELENNVPLLVDYNATRAINQNVLKATDADNATPQTLTYTLLDAPQQGDLTLGSTFTQTQINAGALCYTRTGAANDEFTFTVSDGQETIGPFTFTLGSSTLGNIPQRNNFEVERPTLTWSAVNDAIQYQVQISTSQSFDPLIYNDFVDGAELSFTMPINLPDRRYYWRVRAKDSDQHWGAWSRAEAFWVDAE